MHDKQSMHLILSSGTLSDSDVSELNCQRNGAAQIAGATQGRKGSYERGSDFEHDCTHRGRSIETNSTAVPLKFLLLAHARHPALPPLLFSAAKASKGKAASLTLLDAMRSFIWLLSLFIRSCPDQAKLCYCNLHTPRRAATLFSPTAPLSLPAGPARPS